MESEYDIDTHYAREDAEYGMAYDGPDEVEEEEWDGTMRGESCGWL